MSLEVLPGKEETSPILREMRYSPTRDIAHLLPGIISAVAERLEDGAFAPMTPWLKEAGVTMDDLGEAAGAYAKFMAAAVQSPHQSLDEALQESGWLDARWEAQVAVMYYVGAAASGSFYKGAKEVNAPDQPHVKYFVADMAEAGKVFERATSRPAWKRWLCRKSRALKKLIYRSEGTYREF